MKLIVGLGNPGREYINTRHNTGFLVVEEIAKGRSLIWQDSREGKLQYSWFNTRSGKIELIKPQTFMNGSGMAAIYAKNKHGLNVEDIYVVHDDLDLKLGEFKIQFGRGPKDHNGLKSVDDALGTDQYWHVRVGVDNRPLDNRPMGEEYVLQNFTDEEKRILDGVAKQAVKDLINRITAQ